MQPEPCAHCGTTVPSDRVHAIRTAPRWQDGAHAPITCVTCQQSIDVATRALASGAEPTEPSKPATVDSHGLPDYSGPAAPAPALKVIGPDTVCWPVTVSHAANSRIDSSPLQLGDGSLAYATDRAHPGLPPATRTQVRNLLAQVGINSLGSWRSVSHARGSIGQEWRKRARAQVEATLRLPHVTAWLAATHRAEHEHESDPGQVTGQAILPGVESTVESLDSELEYLDSGLATLRTQPTHRADLRPRPRAGRPEDARRPAESLAHVPQSPSALDAGSRQRQHERIRYRAEHSLSRAWERYPSGTPRGAVEVTDLNGNPVRTDLPPWPEPAQPSTEPSGRNNGESTQADRKRRQRARARAAKTVASAAASGDVARLAAAQRAAGRTVSAAVSSHPWE